VSVLEFIAALASAVGWPLAAVVIVLVLRRPIARMLTERPPKRVRAGPFEAEWDQAYAQAETEVQALPPAPEPELAADGGSLHDELGSEVRTAPAVAVLEAFARVEQELRKIVAPVNPERAARMSALGLARAAAQAELISPGAVPAIEALSVLRNLAAHGGAREITTEQAGNYLDLADACLTALRAEQRARTGPHGATEQG
jgi:hypothetical protein